MTTFASQELICNSCGARSSQTVVLSTNSFGTPDLDSRPPEAARSDLLGIQRCQSCGYCAPDISEGLDGTGASLESANRSAVASSAGPLLARQWNSWSLVNERAGDRCAAGWASLRAAWASDDARDELAAQAHRALALDHLSACVEAGDPITKDTATQELVLLDLHRRLGHDAETLGIAELFAARTMPDHVRAIAQFQTALIQRHDLRCYSVRDAQEYAESPDQWISARERKDAARWWQFWR
jgi:hypothetical protein